MSSVGIKQNSALSRTPKVVTENRVKVGNRVVKQKSTLPHYSVTQRDGHRTVQTVSFKPPGNFLNSTGNKFVGQLQAGSIGKIHNVTLRVKVTINGGDSSVLAQSPWWFEQIRIKAQNGNKLLTTLYPETMYQSFNLVDENRLPIVKTQAGISPAWNNTTPTDTSDGSQHTVRIPLIGSIFGYSPIFFGNSKSDLNFEFISNNPIVSTVNGPASLTCEEIDLIVESENLTPEDEIDHEKHHEMCTSQHKFLEPLSTHYYGKTLSPSTECKLDLDAITGDVSYLMVLLKESGASVQGNNYSLFSGLEEGGSVDIQGSSGKSIFGNGTPVDSQYLIGESFASHFPNCSMVSQANRSVYIVPFCRNIISSHAGVKDGYLKFDGDRHYLSLTPGPSFVQKNCDVYIYAYIHRNFYSSSGRYLSSDDS